MRVFFCGRLGYTTSLYPSSQLISKTLLCLVKNRSPNIGLSLLLGVSLGYATYWLVDLGQLAGLPKSHLYPENVGEMVLYFPCRVVARINLHVIGKATGYG